MEKCPNIEKCPIYSRFKIAATKKTILALYCEGTFEKCARKKLKDSGQKVPENLLPSGKMIEN